MDTLLRYRQWKMYLVTADGTLPCGRLKDMLNGVQMVDCRVHVSGPFDPPTDPKEFRSWLEEGEGRMRKDLTELRSPATVSNRTPETHGVETSKAEASKAEAVTERPE